MTTIAFLLQETSVKWTDKWALFFSATAVLLSVIGTVASMLWQKRLEDRRLKHDLFERRYSLYATLLSLARATPRTTEENMSNVRKYSEIQHQAAFLFPADTLKALNKYSLELARMREMSPPKVPVFDDPNAIKYIVQQDKVHEAYANLESRIQGHLTLIDHDHSLWRSLCDRIDRLEARSNEDARKRMGLDSGP